MIPSVNEEVWGEKHSMLNAIRSRDLKLQKIMGYVIKGMIPAIETTNDICSLKKNTFEPTKNLRKMTDGIRMFAASYTQLNQYRKENFKPIMVGKFKKHTYTNNSVSDKLFGDDLQKKIEDIQKSKKISVTGFNTGFTEKPSTSGYNNHRNSSEGDSEEDDVSPEATVAKWLCNYSDFDSNKGRYVYSDGCMETTTPALSPFQQELGTLNPIPRVGEGQKPRAPTNSSIVTKKKKSRSKYTLLEEKWNAKFGNLNSKLDSMFDFNKGQTSTANGDKNTSEFGNTLTKTAQFYKDSLQVSHKDRHVGLEILIVNLLMNVMM
ncbi:unnamed protein product [Mytilus edulis]|uniref:Uncharacterized protein n=1 Tax=Mytilus edulis TaxID=6550 RepID=A0A8S3QZT8_MYTED|nr:unnamed protein product [Mytilus edulis]